MDPDLILLAPPSEWLSLQTLADERKVSPVTSWRWALRGLRGIRLPTLKVGNKRVTTRSLFSQWCQDVTQASDGVFKPNSPQVPSQKKLLENVEAEAVRLGLCHAPKSTVNESNGRSASGGRER
jgi:hypothetical protein